MFIKCVHKIFHRTLQKKAALPSGRTASNYHISMRCTTFPAMRRFLCSTTRLNFFSIAGDSSGQSSSKTIGFLAAASTSLSCSIVGFCPFLSVYLCTHRISPLLLTCSLLHKLSRFHNRIGFSIQSVNKFHIRLLPGQFFTPKWCDFHHTNRLIRSPVEYLHHTQNLAAPQAKFHQDAPAMPVS